ncbi:hypothetical protein AAFF_G00372650 [Aldrovandia affinis]|uniref:Annexin n=1 Tax=Aldrovandia affinis TaxID=143900 RepID=A0AAD7WMD5_9TELE|nr:hypothetical protein AAFF_G00372650 [Aldrovandia affinis]
MSRVDTRAGHLRSQNSQPQRRQNRFLRNATDPAPTSTMSFFRGLIKDIKANLGRDDDDDTSSHGTVSSFVLFSANSDAAILDRAIKAKGVEEGYIMDLLVKRNNEQRQQIKAVYQQTFGNALDKDLESALTDHLKDLALALLRTPAQYDAQQLRQAIEGFGTHEDILIEILASRSNEQIREIKKAYKEEFDRDLEDDIKSDTRGNFEDCLLSLCKGARSEDTEVDKAMADIDARILHEAGEKKTGTDDSVFIDIFTTRSDAQLRKMFERYAKHSDVDISEALDSEMSGHFQECMIAIVKCAMSKPAFFAEKLFQAMEGRGTRTETLVRVLVSRSELDLKKVVAEYKKVYGKPLQQDILAESGGALETVLLTLCGSDD